MDLSTGFSETVLTFLLLFVFDTESNYVTNSNQWKSIDWTLVALLSISHYCIASATNY